MTSRDEDRRRGEHYEQLVELAPDGILIHDGEIVVLANTAAARLAGAASSEQLIGLPIGIFLTPPYLKSVEAELLAATGSATVALPVRDSFHRLDGSQVEVEVTGAAIMDGGRLSAHLVIRDISQRLAAQQAADALQAQLQQAQKMEAVGALAGGVAHEVNNMMTVVIGFADVMLEDPLLTPERVADAREIISAAQRAAGVTRQLLAFSRRAFYHPGALDVSAVVRHLEPIIRRLLGEERQLVLNLETAPRAWVDRGQLEQVMVNLALNARDAMVHGGALSITVAETRISAGSSAHAGVPIAPGHYVTVTVRDTGVGMDGATQTHIFEPFFTTKPMGHGTGLGLAAVYGIVKQNRGYITVESRLEHGTAFTLHFPVAAAGTVEERRAEERGAGKEVGAGATILVVEDEPAVRAIVTRCLELGGFSVLQAADGTSALEIVTRAGPPQLVLTDLMMPGMGGSELAQHLREHWPRMPILFMSGYSSEDLQRQGATGADQVTIQKPFTPDSLLRSVSLALAAAGAAPRES